MSVLSRKHAAEAEQDRRQQLAWVAAAARAAVPMAKAAGMAAQNGARSAATWATPGVNGARAWTAPRIERSGLAIKDTVAPKIYDVFTATARRVDVAAPRLEVIARRRRWPRAVVAGTALLTAAGAATAIVLRRRKDGVTGGAPGQAADVGTGLHSAPDGQPPSDAAGGSVEGAVEEGPVEEGPVEGAVEEDVSRQSPAT
jgi:hypothetical protein